METNEALANGIGIAFMTGMVIFSLIISIIIIAAQWKIYKKAGQPGWACIIPIFNFYILLKIVGKPSWWLILLFVPIANFVIAIWTTNLLAKRFGKDELYTVGLLLLPIVFYPILGFGSATYTPPSSDNMNYFENK